MRLFSILFLLSFWATAQSQDHNLALVSNVQYSTAVEYGNDIWGFVDKNGVEYAVVGSRTSTLLFSLADPSNPELVYEVEGAVGIWRDMKSVGDYIYVTADQGNDGLLVIDMSAVGDSITHNFWRPIYDKGSGDQQLNRVHNIYADDRYVYLAGLDSDNQRGGVLILDTEADPLEPPVAGVVDDFYAHDVYVQDTFLYASEIYIGELGVYSIADPANPVRLSGQRTTTDFTHNAWVSDDGDFAFTTDEVRDANVDAYDISDLDNIKFLDAFQPYRPLGEAATIPHNTHYHNGFLVTSWYEDGVIVIDGNKPDNLVEVASYDTWLQASGTGRGFNGCWGVTPYLPSGLVIANDINTGLYVFEPTYVRASYLEGMVVDSITRELLPGATVEILGSRPHRDVANDGTFKTGIAETGTFDVRVRALGYDTRIVSIDLEAGVVNEQTFALLQRATLTTILQDNSTGSSLSDGQVLIVSEELGETLESSVNNLGEASNQLDRGSDYDVYGTSWSYQSKLASDVSINGDEIVTIALDSGIVDDFFTDLGWEVTSNSASGEWQRVVPVGTVNTGTNEVSNPDTDVDGDVLNFAYVTGNDGIGLGDDDVDDGSTVLTSPAFSAVTSTADSLAITVSYWYYTCCGNAPLDDTLVMTLSNGLDTMELFRTPESSDGWQTLRFVLTPDELAFTDEMRFSVTAQDLGQGHIVEAGIDAFRADLVTTMVTALDEVAIQGLTVSPSPFSDQVQITVPNEGLHTAQIFDVVGRVVASQPLTGETTTIATGTWRPGVYYVRLLGEGAVSQTISVVKQ
jgi:choice-of-anchor B domain-containing protein